METLLIVSRSSLRSTLRRRDSLSDHEQADAMDAAALHHRRRQRQRRRDSVLRRKERARGQTRTRTLPAAQARRGLSFARRSSSPQRCQARPTLRCHVLIPQRGDVRSHAAEFDHLERLCSLQYSGSSSISGHHAYRLRLHGSRGSRSRTPLSRRHAHPYAQSTSRSRLCAHSRSRGRSRGSGRRRSSRAARLDSVSD